MTTPTTPTDLTDLITRLPKAELHVHHVGSASPHTVAGLAARHPGVVPEDPEALARYFRFTDFAHFIEVYLSVVDLIREPRDVRDLTYGVAVDLAAQNVRYAELTVTPYTSIIRGIAPEAFVEAIEDARVAAERDLGITLRWIFDIPGESGIPAAEGTLQTALDHGPSTLVGFGLGGPEIGVPRPQFAPYFAQARAAGLHSVPHAGESSGPQTMWDAIETLGAERLGHGIAAAQDPELMAYLGEHAIALEVCPTSNIATRCVASIDEHPLPTLVAAGVPITINSDDPPMFGTTLNREYQIAAQLLKLDAAGIRELATAAVAASFAEDSLKTELTQQIQSTL
ncbi:MAG: adenosine deaminase [Antricoccus sp.]